MLPIDLNPTDRLLRQFGWIALPGFGAMAGMVAWKSGLFAGDAVPVFRLGVCFLAALALACPLFATLRPKALLPIWRGMVLLTAPIGFVVGHVVLTVVYLLVFTPVSVVFRLIGRDAMQRRFDRDAPTYWERRPPAPEPKRYF